MKKILIIISFILLIFIGTTLTVSYFLINGDDYLKSFNLISVNNVSTKFNIKFEKVKAAKEYEIVFYNNDDSIMYKEKTPNNNLIVDLKNIENNQSYQLNIFAYNDKGEYITVNNPYSFIYLEPTFNKNNSLVFNNNEDYNLMIDGNLIKKNYFIEINYENKTLKKEIIKDNEYTINKEIFTNKKGIFNIKLYDQNTVLNEINIYSNLSPISDIKIDSPINGELLDHEDINLSFTGGDNATSLSLVIYKGNNLIKKTNINKNNVIISSEFFNKGENYTLKVYAYYNDINSYTKFSEVNFTIKDKETLKPCYISNDSLYSNGKVILNNPNDTGTIYYTIDETNPNINGIEYKDAININKNTIIKTIIKDNNNVKNDSKINSFHINLSKKDIYKVYLNMNYNSDNKIILDNIKDNINNSLKKYNVEVINNESNNINTIISEVKNKMVDLYLSLKTEKTNSHDISGFTTWISNDNVLSYNLGNLINSNLNNVYYENANRGLKYTYNSLEEINSNIPYSILINLGYIDNAKDLKFLTENEDEIANSISDSIIKYFGLF